MDVGEGLVNRDVESKSESGGKGELSATRGIEYLESQV